MQGRDLDRGKGEGQLVEVRKEEIDPGEQGSTAPVGSNPRCSSVGKDRLVVSWLFCFVLEITSPYSRLGTLCSLG